MHVGKLWQISGGAARLEARLVALFAAGSACTVGPSVLSRGWLSGRGLPTMGSLDEVGSFSGLNLLPRQQFDALVTGYSVVSAVLKVRFDLLPVLLEGPCCFVPALGVGRIVHQAIEVPFG